MKVGVQAAVAATQMGADVALGALTGGGSMLPMVVRSFGGGVQEAREKGYSAKQQVALGLANAATEWFTEKLFGGNPAYDTDVGLVNKLVAKVSKNERLVSALSSLPADIISEGLEEIIADVLEPISEKVVTGNWTGYDIDRIIEDGVVGMLLGGVGQGGNVVVNAVRGTNAQSAPQTSSVDAGQTTTISEGNLTPAANSPAEAQKTASGEAASIGLTSRQNVQRYSNDIDAVFTGDYPSGRVVLMGDTPEMLLQFGAAQRPVTLTQDTAYKIAYPEGYFGGKHNLGMSALKQLPYQIADPVAILRSTSQDNSLVLLTEWRDGDTDVIIPLHLDRAGALGLENRVPSAYGKGNIEALIGKNEENVLYTKNNEDIHQLLSKGVQFP